MIINWHLLFHWLSLTTWFYPKWCYRDVSLTYLCSVNNSHWIVMTCQSNDKPMIFWNNLSFPKWYLSDILLTLQPTITGLSIKFQSNGFLMILILQWFPHFSLSSVKVKHAIQSDISLILSWHYSQQSLNCQLNFKPMIF